jgi:hypothetical protein
VVCAITPLDKTLSVLYGVSCLRRIAKGGLLVTTVYVNGDEAEYTGDVDEFAGGVFWVVRMLEGRAKGELRLSAVPPEGFVSAGMRQSMADRAAAQEGFRRLRKVQGDRSD